MKLLIVGAKIAHQLYDDILVFFNLPFPCEPHVTYYHFGLHEWSS